MTAKKKVKRKPVDTAARVYRAVESYVKDRGGNVVVTGIGVCDLPEDTGEQIFHVVVKCVGRKPSRIEGRRTSKE